MQTVEDRIEALEQENKLLKQELIQKTLPNINDNYWAQAIIDSLPNPLFIKNDEHKFVSFNQAFADLLKRSKEEILNKTDYELFSKEQSDIFWRLDSEVLVNGKTNWNEENLTINKKEHTILTSKARIKDRKDRTYILRVITDITENQNQHALLLKKNSEIEAQKKNVQTLLKEIHHRVKNNMQIVSSLLNMQMHLFSDPKVQNAFNNCKNRILAMAKVHEILYQTNNFTDINFETYLESLIDNIRKSYRLGDEVAFDINVISLYLNIEKAIPLGLILNEIITNAIKHGSYEDKKLTISTRMVCNDEYCTLEVGDDGIGMDPHSQKTNQGLGRELIELLSEQLGAECELLKEGPGVNYRLRYKPQ